MTRSALAAVTAVLVGLTACGGGRLDPPAAYEPPVIPLADRDAPTPSGRVVVAYPEEPSTWYPDPRAEPAAVDLAHLWGVPLYRVDAAGQLRPALALAAHEVEVAGGWGIEIELRPGTWSDGVPITARDVVATIESLRTEARWATALDVVTGVVAVSDERVRLEFARPIGRWPYLLAGGWSVLPAHVLKEGGLAAYDGAPSVSGGPFEVVAHEPGRRLRLAAHEGAPGGGPALAELEIAFVPEFDTALGLLQDGEVDVLLGYLALNPIPRAAEVEGATAAAPLGGTIVGLTWRPDAALGGPSGVMARQVIRDAIDVKPQVEGLLGDIGAVARSLLPGQPGPWGADGASVPDADGVSPTILVPRWQEAPAFTARSLQRDLRTFDGGAELVRLEPDALLESSEGDGALVVRRDTPWPSVAARVTSGDDEGVRSAARAADRAPHPHHDDLATAENLLFDKGHVLPLYRVGVAHVWRHEVEAITPSSWPGLAFWNVTRWRLSDR